MDPKGTFTLCDYVIIPDDLIMHSRYLGLSMATKSMAFIPCIVGFLVFFVLVGAYGRIHREESSDDGTSDAMTSDERQRVSDNNQTKVSNIEENSGSRSKIEEAVEL